MSTLLLVDDDLDLLELLSMGLDHRLGGWRILTAADGQQALTLLESQPVDFILTDLDMPVMNGYELISRASRKHPGLPIVVMTGCCLPETAGRVRELGAAGFLAKPLDLREVARSLEEMLRSVPAGAAGEARARQGSVAEGSPARTTGSPQAAAHRLWSFPSPNRQTKQATSLSRS